jgi:hypothetical protein
MRRTILLCAALLTTSPLWSQSENDSDVGVSTASSESMLRPAPVSDRPYPVEVGTGARENFLSAGLVGSVGYVDNLYPGAGVSSVGEKLYVILPTVALDMSTDRQHISASYSPGFTFYQPSSTLNEVDQNVLFNFDYRFTPHLRLSLGDTLQTSSTGFGQAGLGIGGNVSGSAPTLVPGVYAPFGRRLINAASGQLSDQLSPHGMIGATGEFLKLDYPNLTAGTGLYDSDSRGGGGFYNERVSAKQYLGAIYQYEQTLAYPPLVGQYETDTNTISGFYTIYLTDTISLSVTGGPQHYTATHSPAPTVSAWSPTYTVSGGWRRQFVSVAGNFSHTVAGGGGLLGAYHSTSTSLGGRWQMSSNWSSGVSVSYASNTSASPALALNTSGGHSLVASASLERPLAPRLRVRFQYDRIQESYSQVQAIATNPSSNREMVTLLWELRRPIGR